MQISLKWINELVNIETVSLDYLIEKLTLGGFEVEEILEVEIENQKQVVLDISATANRSDSLSIQGFSLEIAALLNKPSQISDYSLQDKNWNHQIKKFSKSLPLESPCSTFLSVIIENIENTSVPKWIKQKLVSSGITPLNNLLDFQNYILLETGYPFAFYDFDKISSKLGQSELKLSIAKSVEERTFFASNGEKYQLNDSILLINANDIPISIAGIIESQDFSYSQNTNCLLIEASIFNAAQIRQQARSLGLRTERSARYEKSLKNTYLSESLYRLVSLLRISNPNIICKLHTVNYADEQVPEPIILRYKTITEILGPIEKHTKGHFNYIEPEIVASYLDRLNFKFIYDNSDLTWEVLIPYSRSDDVTREIDIIEEIGRLHGFNNFLTTLPKIKTIGNEDPSYETRKKITSSLLNLGFNELIHYSLVNETTFLDNEIKLINPLLSDCSSLRSSLLPSLVKTAQENLNQGNLFIEGFEYGHVFSGNIGTDFQEQEYVAGIFGGIRTKLTWSESTKALSWFEAKGKMEQIFKQLNLSINWEVCSSLMFKEILHPYRSAELYLPDNSILGTFGQINPILANRLNISAELYLFEFNVELIKQQIQVNKLPLYQKYSSYPKIIKDLSFIIKQDISFNKLQEALYCNGTQFLSEINLLDEYRGSSIPELHTSLCLQLIFQSDKKTLENKQIDNIISGLQLLLTEEFGALIRE
jgi:phenylalanyl-tRNA synthetase beta chain